jgi:fatty acid desaturase
MTAGFAQEWLAWKDQRKTEREDELKSRQIFWTRFAAITASIAAGAAGWAWTICCKVP